MFGIGRKKEPESTLPEADTLQRPKRLRAKKTGPTPWGKKERLFVGGILVFTIAPSLIFGFKLPSFGSLSVNLPKFDFNQTIVLEKPEQVMAEKTIDYRELENKLLEIVADAQGTYGVWAIDTKMGKGFGFNESEKIEGASLFKLPLMIAVFKDVDTGKVSLDDPVAGESYRSLLTRMGKNSDNDAFATLLNKVGRKKVDQMIIEIGMKNTSFGQSATTAFDISLLFDKLQRGELISNESRSQLLEFITDTKFEDWIVKGIPSNIKVSHKYGRETGVLNDAGIIFSDSPIILSVLSENITESEAGEIIPQLAKTIFEELR